MPGRMIANKGSTYKAENPLDTKGTLCLTDELMRAFLEDLAEIGCTKETIAGYRRSLGKLRRSLDSSGALDSAVLSRWQSGLLKQGYSPRTVNNCTSAVNSLLQFAGRRELQLPVVEIGSTAQPELTRNEYLRLLSAARMMNKQQAYLLVKLFGTTGLSLHDLPRLTVGAVQRGTVELPGAVLHIPECLRQELMDYMQREALVSGPVFVTKNGLNIRRTNITKMIQSLCKDAQVAEEKATPRCLKKLYQTTQAGIQVNIALLVEQAHDRLLETEQLAIGWERKAAAK